MLYLDDIYAVDETNGELIRRIPIVESIKTGLSPKALIMWEEELYEGLKYLLKGTKYEF